MKNGKIESAKRFFIIYHFSFINQRSLTERLLSAKPV